MKINSEMVLFRSGGGLKLILKEFESPDETLDQI
jgi:hypothetical protein